MQLRKYQQRAISDIRRAFADGYRRVCFQLPTGGGKTIVSAFMIKNAIEKGNKVLFLVHLKELLDQTEEKLKQVGVTEGYKLAMIQTYSKRLDYDPGFIVIDECHHTRSATYQTILDKHANVPLVGLSATPLRLDGKGLGSVFDVLIQGPKMQELIEQGYLADYDVVSVNSNVDLSSVSIKFGDYNKQELESALNRSCIYGDAISNYKKFLNGKKAIAFCTSIEASKKLAIDFQNNGVPAAHLDGTLDKKARTEIITAFRNGEILVLCNCSLIAEGFDVPDCEGIIMLRPTQSLSMYLQMVGRGLRAKKDGSKALIIDHVRNWSKHGLPCQDRTWGLEDRIKRKTKKVLECNIRVCEQCFIVYHCNNKSCPQCGFINEEKIKRDIEVQEAELQIIEKKQLIRTQAQCRSFEDLKQFALKTGKKPGWAWHVYQARQRKRK